ncbi:Metallo-dependent phosphatase-like protein [Pilobolus umbonatus]|nr:Metallo-dependent phosphatase-like protein [Pilobolus umbonatus]
MEHGPISLPGIGNYFLKILSNGTMAATHDFTLYFLDSHSNNVDNPEEYDPITGDQLDWVVRSANTFKKLPTSPNAAVFFHIPIWEYNTNNNDNYVLGDQRESVTSPPKNDVRSALESFKQAGNIRMTVCGHDHVNDYCTTNGGITLCYGGGAGVGGYGASHLGWPRRSRIYNILDHGHKIQTWKRLHNARLELKHFQTLYES